MCKRRCPSRLRWLISAVSIARFREIEGISPENAEKLWRSVRSAIEIAINHDGIIELIHDVAAGIDCIDLAHLVVRADPGLRAAITAVAANNPWLVELTVEVAKSKGQNKLLEQAVIMATRAKTGRGPDVGSTSRWISRMDIKAYPRGVALSVAGRNLPQHQQRKSRFRKLEKKPREGGSQTQTR
jgi:hypothetical protein